jgi:hypothetical protein
MLERMRTALVESYVGAIVVGWLLADGLIRVAGIFTSPIFSWVTLREFHTVTSSSYSSRPFPFQAGLPDAISAALLLLMGYGLLRWLYYPREVREASGEAEVLGS